jgi:hypothetical protein
MSKLVVICAVLPSMMLAEQYFSWLMASRTLHGGGRHAARHGEMHVDGGEHLGVCIGALGRQLARCSRASWRPR